MADRLVPCACATNSPKGQSDCDRCYGTKLVCWSCLGRGCECPTPAEYEAKLPNQAMESALDRAIKRIVGEHISITCRSH